MLLAGAASAALILPSRPTEHPTVLTPRLLNVSTAAVELQDVYEVEDRFLGRIEATRSSRIGFELGGTLLRIRVHEGDPVAAGEVLAEIDTARLRARQSELQAAITEALATETLAEATYRRMAELLEQQAVSNQATDEALQRRDAARAALVRTRAQLEAIEVELAKCRLVAPYAGQISGRYLDEGVVVRAGEPVLEVMETGALRARVGIDPRVADGLRNGDRIILRTFRQPAIGTVVHVLPQRDPITRTVDVLLELSGDLDGMRDGDLVELPVRSQRNGRGAWVPWTALTEAARGLWTIYVVSPEPAGHDPSAGRVERRLVEVLEMASDRVYVRGALEPGERFVTDGLHRLAAGQQVRQSIPAP